MDRIEYKDYPLPDGYAWVIQPHLVSAALCEQERRTSNRMKYRSYIAFNKDAETWTVEVWGGPKQTTRITGSKQVHSTSWRMR